MTRPPMEHDFRRLHWGRSWNVKQAPGNEPGVLTGLTHCTPYPLPMDTARWRTGYGEAVGLIVLVESLGDPTDHFRVIVRVIVHVTDRTVTVPGTGPLHGTPRPVLVPDDATAPTGPSTPRECPFCDIVTGRAPATGLVRLPGSVSFRPLNPVVPGHRLLVSKIHVEHFAEHPAVTASVCRDAAEAARHMDAAGVNLITSWGTAATQTVQHLHVHLVPREPDDGLHLPWTGQVRAEVTVQDETPGEGVRR